MHTATAFPRIETTGVEDKVYFHCDDVSIAQLAGCEYEVAYIDPPWSYKDKMRGHSFSLDHEYDTQKKDWIQALPIRAMLARDAAVFTWVVSPQLDTAIDTIRAWGLKYKTVAFCWSKAHRSGKDVANLGKWTMGNVELCVLATKGHPKRRAKNIRQLVRAERTEHSRKPDAVRRAIEALMGDVPRIELFARGDVAGWDCWGNDPIYARGWRASAQSTAAGIVGPSAPGVSPVQPPRARSAAL